MSVDDTEESTIEVGLPVGEQSYQSLFENATAGIGRSRISDGRVVLANKTLADMFGYPSVDEFIENFTFADRYADPQQRLRALESLKQESHGVSELTLLRSDDAPIIVQADSNLLEDGEHLDFVFIDITDRKRTEEALRESENRYRMLTTLSPVGVFHTDVNGKVTYVNEKWCEIGDMSAEDALGDGWHAALHPGDRRLVREWWEDYAKDGTFYQYEQRYQRRDGSTTYCFVQAIGETDENGDVIGYVGSITDITEQKKAEAAIIEGEDRHRRAAAMAKLGHWVWDAVEDKCVFCSEETAQIHGVSVEEFIAFTNSAERNNEWAHPDDRERFDRMMQEVTEHAKAYDIEYRIVTRDGEVRHVHEVGVPEFEEYGALVRTNGMIQDITSIKEAETAARVAMAEAQSANRAKSNFLSTMSHEIRTPLNGVLGLAQLLTNTDLDDDQQKKVNTILSSGHALLAILNDVLDMSRIEAGGLELEEIAFSLRDLISSIATPFQSLADDKGIQLKAINQIETDGILIGDPVRLRQVVWNLLSNAIKFTNNGGVTLTVAEVSHASSRILNSKDQTVRITVADTGIGISPERLDAIFLPFSQEDSSITRKFGGTGLGLSIVKQLTEMMGGTIDVESDDGDGTRFSVYLPFCMATESQIDALMLRRLHEEIEEIESLKILVAEDNDVNAMIAYAFLQKFGHEVRLAENGRIAVDIARENWADVILMDIHMPEMDGIEATRVIRSTESGSMLPIIGLTAEAFSERHAEFIEAGMDSVLTKPFTEQQLAQILVPHGQRMDVIENKPKVDRKMVDQKKEALDTSHKTDVEASPIGKDDALIEFQEKIGSDMMGSLLDKAQTTLEMRMADLRRGLETSDSDLIVKAAHSIKGSSGSLFAARVSMLAAIMEEASVDLAAVRDLMPVMEQTADETIRWWRSKII